MCGFAGFVDSRRRTPPDVRRRLLEAMGAQLARRGPDDQRIHDDGRIALVFRRLAIVDLETGAQPIYDARERSFVAVNGEIYNHADLRGTLRDPPMFRTRSDAEIVLHLYAERGLDAIAALMGKFAIALWDADQERLVLARDRAGIKPLYYFEADGLLLFGSELKALLVHPDCPRDLAWSDVRRTNTTSRLCTFLNGVKQLPGGTLACFEGSRLQTRTYWSFESCLAAARDAPPKDPKVWADEYADVFVDAVRQRLMSDVPLGGFLSGGLDSALVMAVASRSMPGLPVFHALERTTFKCGDSAAARTIATELGLELHSIVLDDASLLDELNFDLDAFEYFVWLLDAPRFELDWFFKHELHRVAKTVVPSLKVMLLGQGADEFAGGYSRLYAAAPHDWRSYVGAMRRDARIEGIDRAGVAPWLVDLLADDHPAFGPRRTSYHDEMVRRVGTLQNYNLWHEDRTAAGQGIEARVPFLDHRLLELLASVPEALHEQLFFDKRLVRDVARRFLPAALVERPKVGFYHTHDVSSIERLTVAIARRVFPRFEEKYLAVPSPTLSPERMRSLFERIQHGGSTGFSAADRLVSAMAVAVFERLLVEIPRGWAPRGLDPPSHLRTADEAPAAWGAAIDSDLPEWTDAAVVRLEADVEIVAALVPAGDPTEVAVLRDGVREETIGIDPGARWTLELLRALATREPIPVGVLADRLGADRDEIEGALALFCRQRWIAVGTA